jgi:hypothetical protein
MCESVDFSPRRVAGGLFSGCSPWPVALGAFRISDDPLLDAVLVIGVFAGPLALELKADDLGHALLVGIGIREAIHARAAQIRLADRACRLFHIPRPKGDCVPLVQLERLWPSRIAHQV